jgi:hypothetical protein
MQIPDLHKGHVVVDGQFVNADVHRVVQAITDYEPELEVKWIPPGQRGENEPAFSIWHNAPGNKPYILFYVQDESEFDMRQLQRIIYNDQRATGAQSYSELEALETAQKLVQEQEWLDKMEEASDIAAHILKTPLNTYKVNDNLVIKSDIPFNAADWLRRQ